jgi:glycogen synthase
MNLAIVTDVFPPKCGGSGWSSFYLAKGLQERGHTIHIIMPREAKETSVTQRDYEGLTVTEYGYTASKIPFVRNFTRNELFYPKFADFLTDFFRQHKIELAHGQHYLSIPPVVMAAQKLAIKSVATVRDYWANCYWTTHLRGDEICPGCSELNRLRCLAANQGAAGVAAAPVSLYMGANLRLKQNWLAQADKTIAVSGYVADKLKPFVPDERLEVVPNFIDLERVQQIAGETSPNLPPAGEPFLLYVGKFEENKGVLILLDILRKVRPEIPTLAVGDGALRPELEKARLEGVNLQLPGWLPNEDVLRLMRRATGLVFPSLWPEPLTRVLLEACGAGACILALNTGGTPDIITPGYNGLLASSPTHMAELLADILRPERAAERDRLRQNAIATARTKFSRDVVLNRVENIYQKLAETKR